MYTFRDAACMCMHALPRMRGIAFANGWTAGVHSHGAGYAALQTTCLCVRTCACMHNQHASTLNFSADVFKHDRIRMRFMSMHPHAHADFFVLAVSAGGWPLKKRNGLRSAPYPLSPLR